MQSHVVVRVSPASPGAWRQWRPRCQLRFLLSFLLFLSSIVCAVLRPVAILTSSQRLLFVLANGASLRGALCELRELTYRYRTRMDANGEAVRVARSLDNWDATAAVLGQLLEDEAVEVLGVLCLTTRRQIICWHEVSRGGLAGTSCQIGEVFRPAIVANADAIVVAHNHPSGDPEPSGNDLRMTKALCQAGALIGVRVVDHLVVVHRGFVSLRRNHPALFDRIQPAGMTDRWASQRNARAPGRPCAAGAGVDSPAERG
jgi:DNA repair protein RadC